MVWSCQSPQQFWPVTPAGLAGHPSRFGQSPQQVWPVTQADLASHPSRFGQSPQQVWPVTPAGLANQSVTSNTPRGEAEEWWSCWPHKLKRSNRAKDETDSEQHPAKTSRRTFLHDEANGLQPCGTRYIPLTLESG